MLRALAILSFTLAAMAFGVFVYGWAVLIRDAGFSKAVRRTIFMWPGNVIHLVVVVAVIVFLLLGLTLLGQSAERDRED